MADVNSNININFNTADALAQLRKLQAGLSTFHQTLAEGNLAAANAQKGLNAQLIQTIGATGKFSASQTKVASSTLSFTNALEKNKLSLREYYRYSMAAATANTTLLSKAFAQEREIINRARRDRVKLLQSQYIQLNKANAGFIDALKIMPRSLAMANGRFTELGTRIQYAAQRQQILNKLLMQGSTNLLNFGKNMQWAGRQLMVGLSIPMMMLGGYASKAFRELEQATVKFRRVYGDAFTNDSEVEAAVQNIKMLAKEYIKYGVAVKDTMDMASTAAAAGFSGKALTQQVNAATKLAVLGQIDQQKALETTISLQNAFGLSADQLAEKINFLNAVENQTVLSIDDLTTAIPKAAPVIKQLGGSVEDLAFFLTAMKEGGINAAEGANAIKSGLAALINPTKRASDMLAGFGINIKGLIEANKGDIKGIVVGFARALDTLDPLNRARAIEQLFGKFQFARLSTLFQNVAKGGSQASRAFDLAGASVEELAILSEREMKKVQDAVGTKFQAAVEQFKQDIMPLGKSFLEAVTPIVKFFGKLFEKFNNLGDGTKKVITIIAGLVAGLGPVLLMTFGLLANGLANLIKLFATIRGGIAKLNGQTNVLGAGFNYVTQEQIDQQASAQALHNTHTKLTEVFNVEKVAAIQLAEAYMQLSSQMRAMAQQNPGLFVGGMGGTVKAVKNLPPIPKVKKFADGIVSVPGPKGAGDVVPAMVSPGEAIIPTKTSEKYRGLITAMFNDNVPGFATGRLPWGSNHPIKQSGAVDIGMPKRFAETTQSREIAARIDAAVRSGKFSKMPPTDFGTLLQPFSGRSFPIRGVGGVYRKPDGKLVVVKPTMDEKTALAEVRATEIAREVHGLTSPKQEIRTMIDPTDSTGQRKLIVLESPYDPKIAAATGKFTKRDMIKQLVASTLRADKDLQQANISGNILADVGTAGVFARASGFRDYASNLPGMGEMGLINLLGVKGGAKKFFAQETSSIASGMTAKQYEDAILKEINSDLPKLRKLIDKWNLNPVEKQAYEAMYQRLEEGKKVDWKKLHSVHIAAGNVTKKYSDGIDPSPNEKVMKEAISRYMLEGNQSDKILANLKGEFDTKFINKLNKLKNIDPERAALIQQAWHGGGKYKQGRQSQFHHVLKDMVPIKVGEETLYISKTDFNKFASDPEKQLKYARSKDYIIDRGLYRMGLAPDQTGRFVGGGDLTKSRALSAKHFAFDLQTSNKSAGGGRGLLSKTVRKIADDQRKIFQASMGDPLKTTAGQILKDAKYSPEDIKYLLRPELSHLEGHQLGERQGSQSMKTGYGMYDARLVNNFMNSKKRHSKLLQWNEDEYSKLASGKKGYPFLSPEQIDEYKKAATFMSLERHPVNAIERELVAKAVELDILALNAKEKGIKVPGTTQSPSANLRALKAILDPNSKIKPSSLMDLQALESGKVLVQPGEIQVNNQTGKISIVRGGMTAPTGSVRIGGSQADKIIGDEKKNTYYSKKSFMPQSTSRSLAFYGRETGTPGAIDRLSNNARGRITNAIREQERLLKQQNKYTKEQIDSAMKSYRRKLVADEQAKAISYRQQQIAREEIRQQQSKVLNDKQAALAAKQQQKETVKQNRMMRQEKIGRFSGGTSMVLGTAGMAAMMSGHTGVGAALTGASAIAGMAPMFAGMGPIGIGVTAVAALAGGMYMLDRAAKKAAESQSNYIDSITATTSKMAQIGEITNKVGASEIMARRRLGTVSDKYTTGFERGKQQFGTTFLDSSVGKDMLKTLTDNLQKSGTVAVKNIAAELSAYISDGILTAEQAHSIARAIGINLQDMTLAMNISAQVTDLVGPNGENLVNNPLQTRLNIVNASMSNAGLIQSQLDKEKASGTPFSKEARNYRAQQAALGVQGLEINQAQLDSYNLYYEKQIKSLETQKAITTDKQKQKDLDTQIKTLQDEQLAGQGKFAENSKKILEDQLNAFKDAQKYGGQVESAFFNSLKNQVKTKYKGTAQEGFVDSLLKQTAELKSKTLEVSIDTVVASGELPPATAMKLLDTFAGDEATLEKTFNVLTSVHDAGAVTELINSLGGITDKDIQKNIIISAAGLSGDKLKEFQSVLNLLNTMQGKEIDINTFIKNNVPKDGNPIEALTKLSNLLNKVEKFPKKITQKTLIDIQTSDPDMPSMQGLIDVWKQYENLPDSVKKTVVQEYISLYKSIGADEAKAFIAKKTAGLPSDVADRVAKQYITSYNSKGEPVYDVGAIAADMIPQSVKSGISSKDGSKSNAGIGGTKQDPYADLLKRLKEVRNAAIDAAGGISSLNKALAEGNVSSIKNKYAGIEQQLQSQGYNQGFIDFLQGMDPAEQKKWMQTTYTASKGKYKGQVIDPFTKLPAAQGVKEGQVVLSANAKKQAQGFDALVSGEFNSATQKQINSIKYQNDSYRKLIAAGYDHLTAQKLISDEYLAQAIATGKLTQEEINQNAIMAKEIVTREKINSLITQGRDAINQQNMYLKNTTTGVSKVQELLLFLQTRGMAFSGDAIRNIIGDPETLSTLIAGMDNVKAGIAGAADAMNELVAGVKALKDNSDITFAIKFATQTMSQNVQSGMQSAQNINNVLKGVYSNLNVGELSKLQSFNPIKKTTTNVGQKAIEMVNANYAAAGMPIPKISATDTLKSIQKQKSVKETQLNLARTQEQYIQNEYNSITDQINNIDKNLQESIDGINKTADAAIKIQQDQIDANEKLIKDKFEAPTQKLDAENKKLSNDLAIIDHAAEQINKKYDAQVQALEEVNKVNQQILDSQKQQLDIADALTQGDIAAAAKSAQDMRAASAANYADNISNAIEQSRQNDLAALRGTETGMTKDQIAERQYQISQELYKLETDPERLKLEQAIEDAKNNISKIEEQRTKDIQTQTDLAEKQKVTLEAQQKAVEQQLADQTKITTALETDVSKLTDMETYMQSIADAAAELDDSTGMTLEDWLTLSEKLPDISKLTEDYKNSLVAAATSSGEMATSWSSVLASINAIPSKINISSVLDIVKNITENITRYIKTVYDNASDGTGNGNGNANGSGTQKPGAAWISDGKGGWKKPDKPFGDYEWDDNKGWNKQGSGLAITGEGDSKSGTEKIAADKAAADAAAAKAAADKAAAEGHKGTYAEGLAIYPWVASTGSAAPSILRGYGYWAKGGMIPRGTDTVPAMLTPGEFIMSKYAVDKYGVDNLRSINNGNSVGDSVYNYSINVNVKSDANPDDIAKTVMAHIQRVNSQQIRGVKIS